MNKYYFYTININIYLDSRSYRPFLFLLYIFFCITRINLELFSLCLWHSVYCRSADEFSVFHGLNCLIFFKDVFSGEEFKFSNYFLLVLEDVIPLSSVFHYRNWEVGCHSYFVSLKKMSSFSSSYFQHIFLVCFQQFYCDKSRCGIFFVCLFLYFPGWGIFWLRFIIFLKPVTWRLSSLEDNFYLVLLYILLQCLLFSTFPPRLHIFLPWLTCLLLHPSFFFRLHFWYFLLIYCQLIFLSLPHLCLHLFYFF